MSSQYEANVARVATLLERMIVDMDSGFARIEATLAEHTAALNDLRDEMNRRFDALLEPRDR